MPNNACQVHKVPNDEMALPDPKATGNTKNIKKDHDQKTNHRKEKALADIPHQSKAMHSYEQLQLIRMI